MTLHDLHQPFLSIIKWKYKYTFLSPIKKKILLLWNIHCRLFWRSCQWSCLRAGCSWRCWNASWVGKGCRYALHQGESWLQSSECPQCWWTLRASPSCRNLWPPSSVEWSHWSPTKINVQTKWSHWSLIKIIRKSL